MLLHLVSTYLFSIPISTHIFKLVFKDSFIIHNYEFSTTASIMLILVIFGIISLNIISIVTDRYHKISYLFTGSFLFALTLIQLGVVLLGIKMEVLGHEWNGFISYMEIIITGTFSSVLLIVATIIDNDTPVKDNDNTILDETKYVTLDFKSLKLFLDNVKKLDYRLAFILGIIYSLILVIPLYGTMYFVANFLLGDIHLTVEQLKLLGWIGILGMQGSIVSMCLRLRELKKEISEKNENGKPTEDMVVGLFLNALLRPFIGLSFAHLTFFMLEAGLLQDSASLKNSVNDNNLFYSFNYHVCLAFIAGFTERIATVIQNKKLETAK